MQVAMQRAHVARIGQKPVRDPGRLDIEAFLVRVAIGLRSLEQARKTLPERLQVGRDRAA
jgi:hypothetical protein